LNSESNKKVIPVDPLAFLTEEEKAVVGNLNSVKEFKKGDVLLKEGQHCKGSHHVVTGVVRQFRIVDGEEKTSEFYTEDQSIFSTVSAFSIGPSKFSLDCLEACTISIVPFGKEKEIYAQFPRFEKMCRIASEKQLIKYQEKFALYISSSPEQRYLNLLESDPGLINRVPQYHLASYLGVKPESLSRIRKRITVKQA